MPSTEVRSAADDDRFTFDSLDTLVGILRTVLLAFAGVAVLVGSFTIFNSLSITVAQRTKEFGLLRMVGATRRQVRAAVLFEALLIGLLASVVGIAAGLGLAAGLSSLFTALGMQLPTEGVSLAGAHGRRLAARGHAGDGAGGDDPGAPRDEDRSGRRAARRATPR